MLIVTSATYRESSRVSPELLEKDPAKAVDALTERRTALEARAEVIEAEQEKLLAHPDRAKMDELDVALSAEKLDASGASAISKQIGAACEACHAVYREQDPSTKAFRIKNASAP